MFKKIFIPYDLSKEGEKGLRWAIYLGQHFGASVQIFHVLPQDKELEEKYQEVRKQIEQDVELTVKAYGQENQGQGLQAYDLRFGVGDPQKLILSEIKEQKPDLVVVSTHGWTGLKHFFLGSKTEHIVREAKTPVLVVRQAPHWPFKKILIPVDFSDFTEQALLMAAHLKVSKQVEFELMHVVSMPDLIHYAPDYGVALPPDLQGDLEKSARRDLEKLKAKHVSLEATMTQATGSVADQICQRAQEAQSDLIILPTHGHEGLERLLSGSVAEQVLRYAPCSVLTLRLNV
ncbi:MAG: universal stress protein [Deltaproteobacteria bacterium]|nr:universal stress protein [Deltaproteobacteria bacterium]